MKILLSFLQDNQVEPHAVPAYRFWSYYIKNGIREAGMEFCEVPDVDWAAGLVPRAHEPSLKTWKADSWERTLAYIRSHLHNIDVFLCYLYPKQIDAGAISEIRRLGIPCVNFYCDNVREFTIVPREFRIFDFIWVPELEALPMYKRAGVNHLFLPMPIWIAPVYRSVPVVEDERISFIGSKDELREKLLYSAISSGLPVEVRGSGWMETDVPQQVPVSPSLYEKIKNQATLIGRLGFPAYMVHLAQRLKKADQLAVPMEHLFGKPMFEDYVKLTRESMITLGINRVPVSGKSGRSLIKYSRLRDLEAPMLGACYISEATAGLSSLYETGKDIETYTDIDELLYKCREVARSKKKRAELRNSGQKKALGEHTIPASLQKIQSQLFG